jgi:tryptophan synthase alpha chain
MNKFQSAFEKGKAFCAFVTCGDPDLETTAAVIRQAVQNGADLIEINIPFSDPTAADPVIQEANIRALSMGVTTDTVFDFVQSIRNEIPVPFVVSSYANVVFSYGAERFMTRCAACGIDGVIVPDVPFEERQEFLPYCRASGVCLIPMVAVTSRERVAAIAKEAEGFLYIMACPGTRQQELEELMALARENTQVPCVICLNGTEEYRVRDVAAQTDGVAVDVPVVKLIGTHGKAAPEFVGAYVAGMKAELQAI